ncbi:MAG TPA: hypothetical protein VGR28_05805 [Candidatus Thermoplasmatota archaeon]|nr:hypothetical protein [Candidatus Thermoplasmatota archaeon]
MTTVPIPTRAVPRTRGLNTSLTSRSERGRAWLVGLGALAAIGGFIFLLTAPVQALLGESAWALTSALHGLSAGVLMIGVTVGVFQAYRLYRGGELRIGEMQIGSLVTTLAAAATIFYGNWIYIAYRASGPGSPRTYFLENNPAIHQVFFEFKEFIALFTLPLSVAAAFVIWREGEGLRSRTTLREAVAVVLALSWLYLMLAFGLGAAITKLRGV